MTTPSPGSPLLRLRRLAASTADSVRGTFSALSPRQFFAGAAPPPPPTPTMQNMSTSSSPPHADDASAAALAAQLARDWAGSRRTVMSALAVVTWRRPALSAGSLLTLLSAIHAADTLGPPADRPLAAAGAAITVACALALALPHASWPGLDLTDAEAAALGLRTFPELCRGAAHARLFARRCRAAYRAASVRRPLRTHLGMALLCLFMARMLASTSLATMASALVLAAFSLPALECSAWGRAHLGPMASRAAAAVGRFSAVADAVASGVVVLPAEAVAADTSLCDSNFLAAQLATEDHTADYAAATTTFEAAPADVSFLPPVLPHGGSLGEGSDTDDDVGASGVGWSMLYESDDDASANKSFTKTAEHNAPDLDDDEEFTLVEEADLTA